jgi:hypothetical protein
VKSCITLRSPDKPGVFLHQSSHWLGYFREIWDESIIIASQSKKTLDLVNRDRSLLVQYFLYLGGIHHNSPIRQHMPKERYFTKPKFTLTEFCIQLMFTQSCEDYTQMSLLDSDPNASRPWASNTNLVQ